MKRIEFSEWMLYAKQGSSEIGIPAEIDEIQALVTITVPIIANWKTVVDSMLPK